MIGIGMPTSHIRMPRMRWVLHLVPAAQRRIPAHGSRTAMFFVTLLCVAGCDADPSVRYLGGFGDPVRGAALFAPDRLGDFTRWRGDPAGAARAAAQLELLADSFARDPRFAIDANPAVPQQLARARVEMRAAFGIAPDAQPTLVILALRRAAERLDAGNPAQAEAALASAAFPNGGAATLAALAAAPPLPQTRIAANLVAIEAGPNRRR